jgi:hypothetical protein
MRKILNERVENFLRQNMTCNNYKIFPPKFGYFCHCKGAKFGVF